MRVVLQKIGGKRKIFSSVKKCINDEKKSKLNSLSGIKKYSKQIQLSKKEFNRFAEKVFKNKIIAGYGASATSTTLIYHYNLNKYIDYLVDDFKAKINLFSPGFKIPVYESKKIERNLPDFTIILAWRYAKKIIKKNISYLKKGGKFVLPLTRIKIITIKNYKKFIN